MKQVVCKHCGIPLGKDGLTGIKNETGYWHLFCLNKKKTLVQKVVDR